MNLRIDHCLTKHNAVVTLLVNSSRLLMVEEQTKFLMNPVKKITAITGLILNFHFPMERKNFLSLLLIFSFAPKIEIYGTFCSVFPNIFREYKIN